MERFLFTQRPPPTPPPHSTSPATICICFIYLLFIAPWSFCLSIPLTDSRGPLTSAKLIFVQSPLLPIHPPPESSRIVILAEDEYISIVMIMNIFLHEEVLQRVNSIKTAVLLNHSKRKKKVGHLHFFANRRRPRDDLAY